MELIYKSTLIAQLEKRRDKNARNKLNLAAAFEDNYLISFIESIEVKEIKESSDLEEEIDRELNENWYGEYINLDKFRESAKHFFELGLKARKGE